MYYSADTCEDMSCLVLKVTFDTCLKERGGRERCVNIPCEILTLFFILSKSSFHSTLQILMRTCLVLKVTFDTSLGVIAGRGMSAYHVRF